MTVRSMKSNKLSSKIFNARSIPNPAILAVTTYTVIVKFTSTTSWTVPTSVTSVAYLS